MRIDAEIAEVERQIKQVVSTGTLLLAHKTIVMMVLSLTTMKPINR